MDWWLHRRLFGNCTTSELSSNFCFYAGNMEIYLIRHTKVAISRDFCYGKSDVELADSKCDDIREVKNKLKGISFQKSYTSPLNRCRVLADELSENPIINEGLLEMNFGDWELKKWDTIDRKIIDEWMSDYVNVSPPNGESYMDFSVNSVSFFNKLVKEINENDTVMITTHSGVIRSIVCHVLKLPLTEAFNYEIDYGSVSKIEITDGWQKIKFLNF